MSSHANRGKLRLAGSIKSAKVTKELFKKVNEKVKITKNKKQAKKQANARKPKKQKQPTLAAFGFFKPKPRPGEI